MRLHLSAATLLHACALMACKRFVATRVFEVGVCFCIEEELGLEVHVLALGAEVARLCVRATG